ncbi:MAG: hypothetical protein Fur0046_17800 [Cyanobacteria bacterium J069]
MSVLPVRVKSFPKTPATISNASTTNNEATQPNALSEKITGIITRSGHSVTFKTTKIRVKVTRLTRDELDAERAIIRAEIASPNRYFQEPFSFLVNNDRKMIELRVIIWPNGFL